MRGGNERKAAKLYAEIDRTGFYRGTAHKEGRSLMNVTFRLATEELEKAFIKESTAAGLDGLKGHRSVGGMRASIYNAFPEAGVDALVAFMREFEQRARVRARCLQTLRRLYVRGFASVRAIHPRYLSRHRSSQDTSLRGG